MRRLTLIIQNTDIKVCEKGPIDPRLVENFLFVSLRNVVFHQTTSMVQSAISITSTSVTAETSYQLQLYQQSYI